MMQAMHGQLLMRLDGWSAGQNGMIQAATLPVALREAAFTELRSCFTDMFPTSTVLSI